MNPNLTAWFETIFNVLYLISIWWIVILMTRHMNRVALADRRTAGLIRVAFLLLAAGDSGHVGFRVLAQLLGGTAATVTFNGTPMSLVGLGMLTTAFTVTLFYMILIYVWQARYKQPSSWFTTLLLFAGLIRLIFMALPGNDWGSLVPPQPMSLYRNLPLIVQGVGVIVLIFTSAYRQRDALFKWIGWMIVVSFAFYIPVILFAQQIPLIGMLMIPKTCAYLAVAWLAYKGLWHSDQAQAASLLASLTR